MAGGGRRAERRGAVLDDEVVEAGSKGVMLALTGAACVALAAWGVLAQGCTVNSCVGSYIVLEKAPGELIEDGRAWAGALKRRLDAEAEARAKAGAPTPTTTAAGKPA